MDETTRKRHVSVHAAAGPCARFSLISTVDEYGSNGGRREARLIDASLDSLFLSKSARFAYS